MKLAVIIASILLLALPIAAVATILLAPFWSWLEASSGVESLGHSGPAGWCYGAVYAIVVLGGVLVFLLLRRKKS